MCMTTTKQHAFEEAGLGKAPFRLIAVRENRVNVGGVIRAGGCCDYCSNGIAYEFVCRSADGKQFKVGCDCVLRLESTTNREFVAQVKSAKQRLEAQKRRERAEKKSKAEWAIIFEARALVDSKRSELVGQAHPKISGKTLFDYYSWLLNCASHSTSLNFAKKILSEIGG